MTLAAALVWGFGGAVVLTTILAGAKGLGWTRMSLPWLLGAMFTADRNRAFALGLAIHLANGCLFALVYAAAFGAAGGGSVALGAAIGLAHGLFVATAGLLALPAFHPDRAPVRRAHDRAAPRAAGLPRAELRLEHGADPGGRPRGVRRGARLRCRARARMITFRPGRIAACACRVAE